jgi:hypothetical protein
VPIVTLLRALRCVLVPPRDAHKQAASLGKVARQHLLVDVGAGRVVHLVGSAHDVLVLHALHPQRRHRRDGTLTRTRLALARLG